MKTRAYLSVLAYIILAGFTGLTLWMAAASTREVLAARASRAWPTVEGRVSNTRIETRLGGSTGTTSRRPRRLHLPIIWYSYAVGEHAYMASRLSYEERKYGDGGEASRFLSGFPVGGAVTVHYNPSSPEEAVLEPGAHLQNYSLCAVGWLLLSLAVLTCYAVLKHKLRAKRPPDATIAIDEPNATT